MARKHRTYVCLLWTNRERSEQTEHRVKAQSVTEATELAQAYAKRHGYEMAAIKERIDNA